MTDQTLENLWFDCNCWSEDVFGLHREAFFRHSGLDPNLTVDRLNRLLRLGAVLERYIASEQYKEIMDDGALFDGWAIADHDEVAAMRSAEIVEEKQ